jgi:signal transduction histidine kinase
MATLVGSATSSVLLISSTVNSPTTVPDSSSTFGSSYKKNKGISTSVIAGIIVGVLIAFAVLAAIIFVVKRRSKSKTGSVPELAATSLSQYHAAHYAVEKDANEVAELATPVNELPANDVKGDSWPHGERAELDSAPVNRT